MEEKIYLLYHTVFIRNLHGGGSVLLECVLLKVNCPYRLTYFIVFSAYIHTETTNRYLVCEYIFCINCINKINKYKYIYVCLSIDLFFFLGTRLKNKQNGH